MDETDVKVQEELDSLTNDMQIIAEKIRNLITPLNAIRFYIDDIIENPEYEKHKTHLAEIDKIANKCIDIVREIVDYTMPYFDQKIPYGISESIPKGVHKQG